MSITLDNQHGIRYTKVLCLCKRGIHLDRGEIEYQPLREAFEMIKIDHLSKLDHTMRGIEALTYLKKRIKIL